MSAHWISTLPPVGIAYALGAAGCAVWAIWRKTDPILWSLSGLIFSIALLNAYTEGWPTLKQFRFEYAVPVLVVLFLLPYRSLCLRLIERTGLRPGLIKEQYSGLFHAYALFTGATIVSLLYGKGQDSRLEVFAFIVFVCALHVPMFAFGRSKIAEFVVRSGIVLSKAPSNISWRFFTTVIAILGTPLILALIVGAVVRDDYRLFAVDAVMTAIIFSLLAISRRGQFNERVSERDVNRRVPQI